MVGRLGSDTVTLPSSEEELDDELLELALSSGSEGRLRVGRPLSPAEVGLLEEVVPPLPPLPVALPLGPEALPCPCPDVP